MHQEERWFCAARLDRHQRGLRAGGGLLAKDIGKLADGRSLEDGRERESFAQPILDESEQADRQ